MAISGRGPTTRVLGLLVLVVGASLLTALVGSGDGDVLAWWPAAGLSIGLLALAPRTWWPWLAVGVAAAPALSVPLLPSLPAALAAALVVGCALEALVGAAVLRHGRSADEVRLVDTQGYLLMLRAVACGALTMTSVTALGIALSPGADLRRVVEVTSVILASHLGASLVMLPLVLIPARRPARRQWLEIGVQVTLLGATLAAPLWVPDSIAALALPLPVLLWAAMRLPPLVAALEVGAVALGTAVASTVGAGAVYTTSVALGADGLSALTDLQVTLICLGLLVVPAALVSDQRRALVERLDAERVLSATTLDTTSALIILTDGDGTIRQANAALQRLTGWRPEELAGLRFEDSPLVPPERVGLVREMFADGQAGGLPELREAEVMTRTGGRIRVVWSNTLVRDRDGRVRTAVCTGTDVTAERTSRRLVEQLSGSPGSAPMISVGADQVVTLINPAAEELLGLPAAAVVGHPVTRLADGEGADTLRAALDGAGARAGSNGAATAVRDWGWCRPDGRRLRLSASVTHLAETRGSPGQLLLVISDVTAEGEQREALVRTVEAERQAVRRLQRLDAVRNDFVSTVSHELRTPTTSIVGYTEMLREGEAGTLTEEQQQMLEVIARNGRRLISVSEDLLVLAGLEDGEHAAGPREPVDLGSVVRQALRAMAPLAGERSLSLERDVPDAPVHVDGDPALLDRVVVNLLSNAIKFTPDGGRVSCCVAREDDAVVLRVSDTGIGIPQAEQEELFTKFFRSSTAQARAIPGTGLGLSIVHRIVTEHGGRIAVSSEAGVGTTFTVRLPPGDAAP